MPPLRHHGVSQQGALLWCSLGRVLMRARTARAAFMLPPGYRPQHSKQPCCNDLGRQHHEMQLRFTLPADSSCRHWLTSAGSLYHGRRKAHPTCFARWGLLISSSEACGQYTKFWQWSGRSAARRLWVSGTFCTCDSKVPQDMHQQLSPRVERILSCGFTSAL